MARNESTRYFNTRRIAHVLRGRIRAGYRERATENARRDAIERGRSVREARAARNASNNAPMTRTQRYLQRQSQVIAQYRNAMAAREEERMRLRRSQIAPSSYQTTLGTRANVAGGGGGVRGGAGSGG